MHSSNTVNITVDRMGVTFEHPNMKELPDSRCSHEEGWHYLQGLAAHGQIVISKVNVFMPGNHDPNVHHLGCAKFEDIAADCTCSAGPAPVQ